MILIARSGHDATQSPQPRHKDPITVTTSPGSSCTSALVGHSFLAGHFSCPEQSSDDITALCIIHFLYNMIQGLTGRDVSLNQSWYSADCCNHRQSLSMKTRYQRNCCIFAKPCGSRNGDRFYLLQSGSRLRTSRTDVHIHRTSDHRLPYYSSPPTLTPGAFAEPNICIRKFGCHID